MKLSKQNSLSLSEFPGVVESSPRTKVSNKPRHKCGVKSSECGRSMVEMLGVLAIAGILTVGGIAGYSKAMKKYKINKTLSLMSQIISNTKVTFAQQTSYYGIYQADKLDIFPNDINVYPGHYYEGFGYDHEEVWFHSRNPVYHGRLEVDSRFSPQVTYLLMKMYDYDKEACIALASYDWKTALGDSLVGISVVKDTQFSGIANLVNMGINEASFVYYDNRGSEYGAIIAPAADLPLSMDTVASICSKSDDNLKNSVGIIFK